jgi:hypothetical protein
MSLVRLAAQLAEDSTAPLTGERPAGEEPPMLVELGDVRDVVLGNSSSGNSDANSQYYW